ncbi:MAG: CpaF family protein [Acidimicrobiales bacterium]
MSELEFTTTIDPHQRIEETPISTYRRRLREAALEALAGWEGDRSTGDSSGSWAGGPGLDAQSCVIDAARDELAAIDHQRLMSGLSSLDESITEQLIAGVLGSTLGLGPLHAIFEDRLVEEVLGRWDYVVIHRAGLPPEIRRGRDSPWVSEQQLIDWVSYGARTRGLTERSFNPASPLLVMRLGPGLRLAAQRAIGDQVTFALRRNVLGPVTLDGLVEQAMMPPEIADLLAAAMRSGEARLVFSGATGAGKTTLARACLGELDRSEHVIVMEDTAEIDLFDPDLHPNVESWEVREPNAEQRGGVDLGDLVRHSLRHRPDWNVVGEVRDGRAATPMIAAMTAGVASLTTVHAKSATGALDKLQLYLGMGSEPMAAGTAQLQLSVAIDLVVHVARDRGSGRRFVAEVIQVVGYDGERCQTNLVYREQGGRRIGANVLTDELAGQLMATGFDPRRLAVVETAGAGSPRPWPPPPRPPGIASRSPAPVAAVEIGSAR